MKQLLLLLLFSSFTALSQNADIDLLKSINLGRDKQLDPSCRFISNSVTPVSIAAPVIVPGAGFIKHDSALKNKGLCMGASLLLAAGVCTAAKYTVRRQRPLVTYPFIDKSGSGGSPSFPSGHTSDAFATATTVSLAFPEWYVIAPAYAYACAVGYSRMELGVHYPSDVLGGALAGAGCAFLCYKVNQWLMRKKPLEGVRRL